jgi:hypothetical protein
MEPANHALKSLKLRAKINLSSLRVMCCGLNIQEADARNLISNTTELGVGSGGRYLGHEGSIVING